MKFHCYETETEFVFCVEGARGRVLDVLAADRYWTKVGEAEFIKTYPMDTKWDDAWYLDPEYKEAVKANFARLGESWIAGVFDWEGVLSLLARLFVEHDVEWYILGSASEAVLGVDVNPHDLDIAVHTRDFYKVKGLTRDLVVEPLGDNKGGWLVRYFGKLCVDGASVDIAADDKLNIDNNQDLYEKVSWNGYEVYVTPLSQRYEVEVQRGRRDRIRAIEEFMSRSRGRLG